MKMNSFMLPEKAAAGDYALATYYIRLPVYDDIVKKAEKMALGQTLGTWVEVPGITDEMRQTYMGRVVNILEAPPIELKPQIQEDMRTYFIQIAYPTVNFGADFPMLFTTLLGNDASTSAQVKLADLQLPAAFLEAFHGPKYGIDGIRAFTGTAPGMPLLLNMIKPCTGITPEAGARIFYDTALGGVDFIKDDELLGDPDYCSAAARTKAYLKASDAAFEKTGKRTTYICNITSQASKITDTLKAVLDAGARAVMMCFSTVGYSTFQYIAQSCDALILGHYAGTGASSEGLESGLGSHLAAGKFARMAGADMVMINTPYGGYPLSELPYHKTVHQLTLADNALKPSMPVCGGGVHPGLVPQLLEDCGRDIILAAGGAIQGHPMGAAAGGTAMRQAVDAVLHDIPLEAAADTHEELACALKTFCSKEH